MAVIDFDKAEREQTAKRINKRLFEEIFKIFDEFDIEEWKDIRYLELADIWCEAVEEKYTFELNDEKLKRVFINKIIERLVD